MCSQLAMIEIFDAAHDKGANGIGFRIANKAAARGAKVVILDVAEPHGPIRRKSCAA